MTKDELLYVLGAAEEEANDLRHEAFDNEHSREELEENAEDIERDAALLRKHADAIVELVNRLEAA